MKSSFFHFSIPLLVTLALNCSSFASVSPVTIAPAETQIADFATSTTGISDGIDIYPSIPSGDGENHYVHISMNKTSDGSGQERYVFMYCKNGLSLALAKSGEFPKVRNCYLTIGNSAGYTAGELRAEIDLMQSQAKSQNQSKILSSVGSSLLSGITILVALNLVEVVTTGGVANIPTDGAVAVGIFERYVTTAILKKVALNGVKLLISTVAGTTIGEVFSSKLAQGDTRQTNDNAFSSAGEIADTAKEMNRIISSGSIVIIDNNIETFENDLTEVLGKIL